MRFVKGQTKKKMLGAKKQRPRVAAGPDKGLLQ
jgi:hypothetical protein